MNACFWIGLVIGAMAPSLAAWIVFNRNKHLRQRVRHWIEKAENKGSD